MTKSVFTGAYASLLKTLISLRKKRGVTQVELSERLGKPQPFISYIERGERRVDVVEFYAIVTALGDDPVQVFSGLVKKFPKRVDI